MILVRDEIEQAEIVVDAAGIHRRSTTYDATIGEFICEGARLQGASVKLDKRGIVWVVSRETFKFGPNHTGLATLKTGLTHRGVLALNVGIIDPGWEGPLATALVNFSGSALEISRNEPFFRVMVIKHTDTGATPVRKEMASYIAEIMDRSRHFSATFLNTHSLVDEVATAVFKFPRVAFWVGWAGLGIAAAALMIGLASLAVPAAIEVWSDHKKEAAETLDLQRRVDRLESKAGEPIVQSTPQPASSTASPQGNKNPQQPN